MDGSVTVIAKSKANYMPALFLQSAKFLLSATVNVWLIATFLFIKFNIKIKSLIKENKREVNSKEIANQYLQEINKQENQNKAEIIMKEDIINQEESFKKRLEEKRLLRGNSQPHMKLKV